LGTLIRGLTTLSALVSREPGRVWFSAFKGKPVRRRQFITLLGCAAAWPIVAQAQQPKIPVIGYLSSVPSDAEALAAFRQGLADFGFVED
jgi:hypothetical protein